MIDVELVTRKLLLITRDLEALQAAMRDIPVHLANVRDYTARESDEPA
jgi:hypothetical protein